MNITLRISIYAKVCILTMALFSLLPCLSIGGLDGPHNDSFAVGCLSCHDLASSEPKHLPAMGQSPLTIDDTLANNLCWSCHNVMEATHIQTHSSLGTNNDHGSWTVECWVCHNPHLQEQNRYNNSTYGKYIRKEIDLANIIGQVTDSNGNPVPKTGKKQVKFLRNTGANSFADGDAVYDGICEVCHTQTSHWSPAAPGNDNHYAGQNCMGCHNHSNGFIHGGGGGTNCADCHNSGDHPIHLLRGVVCEQCHGNSSFTNNGNVQFADSQLFAGTTVCAACHSTKPGWGETATACLSCHKIAQGNRTAVGEQFQANSHHIQGIEVADYHCYECHWEARRVDGVVTGKIDVAYHGGQADPGAAVDLVIYGAGARPDSYQESATAIQYLANGSRTEIEKLNNHCLGCHNTDLNGVNIFGDGKGPNYYAWDESSAGARNGTSVKARYSQAGSTTWGKYSGTNYAAKQITKSYSAHGNAGGNARGWDTTNGVDGTITNTSGSVQIACFDCHNSHGSTVSGTTTSYASATTNGGILKDTKSGKGGYAVDYKPTAGGSAANKNSYSPGAGLCFDCHLTPAKGEKPWGYQDTFDATQPIIGYYDAPYFAEGLRGVDQRTPIKSMTISGGHFGASSSLTNGASHAIGGLCTPCHDPHGVSTTLGPDQQYAIPLLKGTWLTSPYKEDRPPAENRAGTVRTDRGMEGPGYHRTPDVTQTETQFAGLCLKCHPKDKLSDGSNGGTWRSIDRIHESVSGWGGGNHKYSCSKCHTSHNSRLPRLMVTNCLDNKHKGRTVNNTLPVLSGSGRGLFNTGGGGGAILYDEAQYFSLWRDPGCGKGTGWGNFPGTYEEHPCNVLSPIILSACHAEETGSWNDQKWNNITAW